MKNLMIFIGYHKYHYSVLSLFDAVGLCPLFFLLACFCHTGYARPPPHQLGLDRNTHSLNPFGSAVVSTRSLRTTSSAQRWHLPASPLWHDNSVQTDPPHQFSPSDQTTN